MTDVIVFILGILSLILFFKVWKMCDNVKDIKEILQEIEKNTTRRVGEPVPYIPESSSLPKFKVSQLVFVKGDDSQFRITEIRRKTDGSFTYFSEKHNRFFDENEIEDLKVYWESQKA